MKGVQTVVELFRRYDRADLVIVGDGTYGPELRRQARGLPQVRFLGRLPFDELASLYAGAVALLAPSVGYETFGMTTLEAFAQGVPAIVRDRGALPETVEESGAGFVYRTDDELLDAMERLRTDAALRADLGERGRRAWRERWSEGPHLREYLAIVDQLRATRSPVAAER
jgi:glycosyltransferase involved in cell wall biosynthesis